MIYLPHRRKAFRSTAFVPNAVDFDGTDYLERTSELTNSPSDGTQLTVSFWMRFTERATTYILVYANTGAGGGGDYKFRVGISSSYTVQVVGRRPADTTVVLNISGSTPLSNGSWYHCLASLDLSDAAKRHLYVNGNSEINVTTYNTAESIEFTRDTKWIGSAKTSLFLNGALSELWFSRTYIDLSVQANREKFRSATGHPVDLGVDGSIPTGSIPDIYMHAPAASFGTNATGYGDFTITGSLTDVTPP